MIIPLFEHLNSILIMIYFIIGICLFIVIIPILFGIMIQKGLSHKFDYDNEIIQHHSQSASKDSGENETHLQ